jgi:hypothetical protein
VLAGNASCHADEAGKGMPRKQAGRRGRIYVNVTSLPNEGRLLV